MTNKVRDEQSVPSTFEPPKEPHDAALDLSQRRGRRHDEISLEEVERIGI